MERSPAWIQKFIAIVLEPSSLPISPSLRDQSCYSTFSSLSRMLLQVSTASHSFHISAVVTHLVDWIVWFKGSIISLSPAFEGEC
jgi:hypothetical protein